MSNNAGLLNQLELTDRLFPTTEDTHSQPATEKVSTGCGVLPTSYSEADNLVQRVFLSKPESAPRVVVFTSAQSGAGCSWVCARTSEALARRFPDKVCVVDANLRSPAMHLYFPVSNRRGLSQALVETDPISEYIQEVRSKRLAVMSTGVSSGKSTPWALDHLSDRIAELRRTFSFLLLDSPATSIYADVTSFSSVADGVILVLEADVTRREVALQARDSLLSAKFQILGAALNKRGFPIPDFIYRRL